MAIKIPRYGTGVITDKYFSIIILAGLITAFGGYMVMEGSNAEDTVLEKQGAPNAVIVFIADPHLRMSNLAGQRPISHVDWELPILMSSSGHLHPRRLL